MIDWISWFPLETLFHKTAGNWATGDKWTQLYIFQFNMLIIGYVQTKNWPICLKLLSPWCLVPMVGGMVGLGWYRSYDSGEEEPRVTGGAEFIVVDWTTDTEQLQLERSRIGFKTGSTSSLSDVDLKCFVTSWKCMILELFNHFIYNVIAAIDILIIEVIIVTVVNVFVCDFGIKCW